MLKKLTAKQEMFCLEYLKDLNATQAAIRAGYKKGCAAEIGCENLVKPNCAERLAQLMAARSDAVKIDAEWVLTEAHKAYNHLVDNDDHGVAKGYLEIVAKHVDVKAFDKTIKVEDARYDSFSDDELIARRDAIQRKIDESS